MPHVVHELPNFRQRIFGSYPQTPLMKPKSTRRFLAASVTTFAIVTLTASAADIYKVNNTDDLNLPTSWSTTSGAQTPNPTLGSDNWYFNEVTMLGNKTVALGGNIAIGGLALDFATTNTANNLVISSGGILTLNAATLGGSGVTGTNYTAAGIVLNRGTGGTLTINADVALGANQQWVNGRNTGTGITVGGAVNLDTRVLTANVATSATTAISGNVSGTGAGAILKTGVGTLTLSGTNSLTGTGDSLTINAGTVSFTAGTSTFAGTIKSSATSTKGTLNVSTGATVNALAVSSSWGSTMAINGALNLTNAFTFSGGTSIITGSGTVKAATLTNQNFGTTNLNGARFNLGAGGYTKAADATTAINFGATTLGAYANWSSSAPLALTAAAPGTTINTLDSVDGTTARTITLSGIISGATGALTKAGAGTLILTAANSFGGALAVTGGTLQAGNGATTGSFGGAGDIAVSLGATLAINRSDAFTFGRLLTGAGGFENKGAGTTTLTLPQTYTGPTSVTGGRLALTSSLTSDVTVASGAKISGTGSTTGLLTMSAGSSIALAGAAATTSVTANGASFGATTNLIFDATPIPSTVYDVVTYGSGTVPDFNNMGTGFRGTFANDAGNKKITFTAGTVGTRTWNTTTGAWAVNTGTNFVEGDQKYFDGDTVVFGDIASDSTVTRIGNLAPGAFSITNTANSYTFTGGSMTGSTGLTKSGAGSATLSSAGNSFTGDVMVNNGTLVASGPTGGTNTVLGLASNARTITVNSGGTLSMATSNILGNSAQTLATTANLTVNNGGTATTSAYNVLGNVALNGGTLTATGGSSTAYQAYEFNGSTVTVGGSTASTISATGTNSGMHIAGGKTLTLNVGDVAVGTDLTISAALINGSNDRTGSGALLKTGDGTVALTGLNVFSGNVTINAGTVDLTGGALYTSAYNNSTVTVNTGGLLLLNSFGYSGTASLGQLRDYANSRVINGGTVEVRAGNETVGSDFTIGTNGGTFRYNPAVNTSTLTLAGNANTNIPIAGLLTLRADGNITVGEIIEGAGSLTKTGGSTLLLNAANTYTGLTTVSAGTLGGTGSLAGPLTVEAAGTLAPGASVGTFTVVGKTTLAGTYAAEINGATSDLLAVTGDLALGGALTVSATAPSGTEWTIATYTGALTGTFTSVPAGYTVNTATTGVVKLVSSGGGGGYSTWAAANAGGGPFNGDFDNDGVSNGIEYFMGQTGSSFTPNPALINGTVSYPRDPSATGVSFQIKTSPDLVNWTDVTGSADLSDPNFVKYTPTTGLGKVFVRLEVTQN